MRLLTCYPAKPHARVLLPTRTPWVLSILPDWHQALCGLACLALVASPGASEGECAAGLPPSSVAVGNPWHPLAGRRFTSAFASHFTSQPSLLVSVFSLYEDCQIPVHRAKRRTRECGSPSHSSSRLSGSHAESHTVGGGKGGLGAITVTSQSDRE